MSDKNRYFQSSEPFVLESGNVFPELKLGYQTFGSLNEDKSNVVWCFHALTANTDVIDWWSGLFGMDTIFDPSAYFIICVNSIGSPYGSIHPESLDFPLFTIRDVVNTQLLLAKYLEVSKIKVAIGGSFGGSQALEFAYSFSGKIDQLVLVACAAQESPWGIAVHESQRLALKADSSFGELNGGENGLKAARAIGMLTYRTVQSFKETQYDWDNRIDAFKAASYITYQGGKFTKRFDALSYYYLTKCLDTHNIGRGRKGVSAALNKIECSTVVIGIDSDQLVPIVEVKEMANHIPNAKFYKINSKHGHDGFLIETEQISRIINNSNN